MTKILEEIEVFNHIIIGSDILPHLRICSIRGNTFLRINKSRKEYCSKKCSNRYHHAIRDYSKRDPIRVKEKKVIGND